MPELFESIKNHQYYNILYIIYYIYYIIYIVYIVDIFIQNKYISILLY